MRVTQSLTIDPIGKVRMTRADTWRDRPVVLRWRAFKDAVREATLTLEDGDSLEFIIGMAPSWSPRKRAAHDGQPHRQAPDLDNLVGALMDAVLPGGDAAIAELGPCRKRWGTVGQVIIRPREEKTFTESLTLPAR